MAPLRFPWTLPTPTLTSISRLQRGLTVRLQGGPAAPRGDAPNDFRTISEQLLRLLNAYTESIHPPAHVYESLYLDYLAQHIMDKRTGELRERGRMAKSGPANQRARFANDAARLQRSLTKLQAEHNALRAEIIQVRTPSAPSDLSKLCPFSSPCAPRSSRCAPPPPPQPPSNCAPSHPPARRDHPGAHPLRPLQIGDPAL
eukprot:6594-Prorocentrum_minimum.AAC.1